MKNSIEYQEGKVIKERWDSSYIPLITNAKLILESKIQDIQNKMEVKKNMSKIGDFAKGYEPPQTTKNIADLNEVSTDLELEDDEFEFTDKKTNEVKAIKQKVIVVNGVNYRVPTSVIQQLKIILEDNPLLKKFKVKRSGSTKDDTRYQVIPLTN